jgi:hypothetical protein
LRFDLFWVHGLGDFRGVPFFLGLVRGVPDFEDDDVNTDNYEQHFYEEDSAKCTT